MTERHSDNSSAKRWLWVIVMIVLVVAATFWFAVPLGTGSSTLSVQPVAPSTDWAPEPSGPAVPVTLPKTPMTNAPEKAP